jgi:hypothetical protein
MTPKATGVAHPPPGLGPQLKKYWVGGRTIVRLREGNRPGSGAPASIFFSVRNLSGAFLRDHMPAETLIINSCDHGIKTYLCLPNGSQPCLQSVVALMSFKRWSNLATTMSQRAPRLDLAASQIVRELARSATDRCRKAST